MRIILIYFNSIGAFRETNDKINIDFRPKNPSFTNLKVARAPLLLNNKDFKFNSSFYKNLTKSSKTEPLRHLSNIHQVIENSFKNEKKSIDEVLPKLKFPLPNNLREIDNVIYENFKGNNQKFLTWNSKKTNVDMESKKIKELKKELDYLNDIARNKYGINIPKKEIIPEADLKHSFFKLQPELLNSKILNFENNSIERNDNSLNISQQRIIGGDENLENGNIFYEKTENSSVPEFLLQNVFLANQEMKKLKGRKPQMMKSTRNFKSQIGSRNPYKTKINFASTYGGSFLKSI